MYYLRTRPAVDAVQFTVDKTRLKEYSDVNAANGSESVSFAPGTKKVVECAINNSEGDCLMCSS